MILIYDIIIVELLFARVCDNKAVENCQEINKQEKEHKHKHKDNLCL